MDKGRHVYIAMSSGVDSSLAAALLTRSFPRVTGIFMNNWSGRCSDRDWDTVQNTAAMLNIPVQRVNFERQYWTSVFERMIDGYKAAITPNPDILCNRHIKFGALYEYIQQKELGAYLATGHYADVRDGQLYRPLDKFKDQTFYLSSLPQHTLSTLIFPLKSLTKQQVRILATEMKLPSATQRDSQGLCFVEQTDSSFEQFLSEYIADSPGDVVDEHGRIVGRHKGLWSYTIGQRAGISMPQGTPELAGRWYVARKDSLANTMTIVPRDHWWLFAKRIRAVDFNWLGKPSGKDQIVAQVRHQQKPVAVQYQNTSNGLEVAFSERVRGMVKGQHLVLWEGDRCLGGGIIDHVHLDD